MKRIILTVTSKTSKAAVEELSEMAKKTFGCDNVTIKTDDSLIGGFYAQYDGVFYDMSIATQLKSLKSTIEPKGE